ncbi:MAG: hypothetical protein ACXADL_11980 [Candidatus Thorarchaeota archaeon]|jgi:hypothetical protein
MAQGKKMFQFYGAAATALEKKQQANNKSQMKPKSKRYKATEAEKAERQRKLDEAFGGYKTGPLYEPGKGTAQAPVKKKKKKKQQNKAYYGKEAQKRKTVDEQFQEEKNRR